MPAVIRKYSKDIAVYNLIWAELTKERENNYLTRYKNAIAFLTKWQRTDIVKQGRDGPIEGGSGGIRISSSPRLFPGQR